MPTLLSLFTSQQSARQCAEKIKQQQLSHDITLLDLASWSDKVSNSDCNQNDPTCQDTSNVMMNIFDAEPGDMSLMLINAGVPQPKVSIYQEALKQGSTLCMVKNIRSQNRDQILGTVNQMGAIAAEVFPPTYSTKM